MRTSSRPIVTAALISTCAAATLAGAPHPAADATAAFRTSVELVALNVVVTNGRQQAVDGLAEQDFVVLEDGVRQPIAYFGGGRAPLDLVLLVDTSASMDAMRPAVQRAIRTLVDALRPQDRVAVVAFATGLQVLESFTEDHARARDALARTNARGSTALFSSIYVALREFAAPIRRAGEVRRLAFVVITDGEENRSAVSLETLLEEARCRGVSIYAVMMQVAEARRQAILDGRPRPGPAAVRQLAIETGATAFFPSRAAELGGIASTIADELSHQYSLAYVPALAGRPLRSVSVQLTGRAGLKVRTRTTWRAAPAPSPLLASR
jgi:VWFA-related protein